MCCVRCSSRHLYPHSNPETPRKSPPNKDPKAPKRLLNDGFLCLVRKEAWVPVAQAGLMAARGQEPGVLALSARLPWWGLLHSRRALT